MTKASDEPKIKLVSENGAAKIAEQCKKEEAKRANRESVSSLRLLTANLLRIIAGAGRPHDVSTSFAKALKHWRPSARQATLGLFLRDRGWRKDNLTDLPSADFGSFGPLGVQWNCCGGEGQGGDREQVRPAPGEHRGIGRGRLKAFARYA
jgi:hypothetical protein